MSGKYLALRNKRFFDLYNFVRRKNYERVPIAWLDLDTSPVATLKEASRCDISPPCFAQPAPVLQNDTPAINLYCFKNAKVSSGLSAVWAGGALYIDRNTNTENSRANYKAGPLKIFDENFCLLSKEEGEPSGEAEGGVLFLGGSGASNYYHWLIEILPKLCLLNQEVLKKWSITSILVDASVSRLPNFRASLDFVLEKLALPLAIIIAPAGWGTYQNLYYINTFNNILFNSATGVIGAKDFYFSKNVLKIYMNLFRGAGGDVRSGMERIFLLREESSVSEYNKRTYNQDEIFTIFKNLGFVGVYVEKLSFQQQINLFASASYIVGPSGAAWANIIFCEPKTRCLSWLNEAFRDFSVYSTLAAQAECDIRFLQCSLLRANEPHGAYVLDAVAVENFLAKEWLSLLAE